MENRALGDSFSYLNDAFSSGLSLYSEAVRESTLFVSESEGRTRVQDECQRKAHNPDARAYK